MYITSFHFNPYLESNIKIEISAGHSRRFILLSQQQLGNRLIDIIAHTRFQKYLFY